MSDQQDCTFQSGNEYTLAQIFDGENRIVIPDLQRDYCWGDKVQVKGTKDCTELVSGFIENLKDIFRGKKRDDKLTLGMIYGYEQPKGHIHLCDGQQRITTLFLLIGMLYRKVRTKPKAEELRKALISDFELNQDDKEPHLQYAIRESTLYFLGDLVSNYFLSVGDEEIGRIKSQDWYFADYEQDPTIQSMIAALLTIDKQLSGEMDCEAFGEFILKDLQVLYYNMGSRAHGEETFVVINTTGEPLTANENLKPILLGRLDTTIEKLHPNETALETDLKCYSRQWEEREEWFWRNRKPDESVADNGVMDFFKWFIQSMDRREQVKDLKDDIQQKAKAGVSFLDEVHAFWRALKTCIELCKKSKDISDVLKIIEPREVDLTWFRKTDLNVVVPLLAYVNKVQQPNVLYEFVRRIRRNFYDKKRGKTNFVDWRYVIQIVELAEAEDEILSFKRESEITKILNVAGPCKWHNDDEQVKDRLSKDHKAEIEDWENHPDMMGDLTPIRIANIGRENSFENLQQTWSMFGILDKCHHAGEKAVNELNCQVLSNYYRLYRVLIGHPGIGHIDRTSGMKGVFLSRNDPNSNDYLKYLDNREIQSLWVIQEPNAIINEIKARVRKLVPRESVELNDITFEPVKHLKAWLFLKVLSGENEATAVSFKNGNGIASYDDCNRNKLNPDMPFSLANSICGYAIKSGRGGCSRIAYCEYEECRDRLVCLDTPIGRYISLSDFSARASRPITQEEIGNVGKHIQGLLDRFYGDEVSVTKENSHDHIGRAV